MLDKILNIKSLNYNWDSSVPILRYVFGISFILLITTLMNYELSYLTTVLALGYIAPGKEPLTMKQDISFVISLTIITGLALLFSYLFMDYPLVFMPLLTLAILWLYYTDKLVGMVKLFSIISILVIPLVSMEGHVLGNFIAISLVFNALMAVTLTQIVFLIFPYSQYDRVFTKAQQNTQKKTEIQRFKYALNIVIILLPALLLFFIFKLSGGLLILIFIAILFMNPALANAKVGSILIIANVLGGIFAILAFKLLVVVPILSFMVLLTICIGLYMGKKLFSNHKFAPIYGSAFSTFLLILGSVTASDDTAGDKVWTRVIQIAVAVVYVVVAFGILNRFEKENKIEKINE